MYEKTSIAVKKNWRAMVNLSLLACVFSVSVFIRQKNIGLPLDRHHEWLTAHTMVILSIWDETSAANYYYSPVYTYNNPGDKKDLSMVSLTDSRGNIYYVSYGPFSPMLPYGVFKLFGIPVHENALMYFNLLLHAIASLFLYLLVLKVTHKTINQVSLAATIAFTLYVFTPGTLWYHCNIYFSEIAVQYIFIVGLYLFYAISNSQNPSKMLRFWYLLICFLMVYTEWLGVFFTLFTGLFWLYKARSNKQYWWLFGLTALSGILALCVIVFQYAQIAGLNAYLDAALARYKTRSGMFVDGADTSFSIYNWDAVKNIEAHLNLNFINVINFLAFLIPAFMVVVFVKRRYFFTKTQWSLLLLVATLVLLHHVVFFNFTALHDFSVLKTGLLLILLVALIVDRLVLAVSHVKWAYWLLSLVLVGFVVKKSMQAVDKYHAVNNIENINPIFKQMGFMAGKHSAPDEKIFMRLFICPQLNYYAKRNILFDENGTRARAWAMENRKPAVFYAQEPNGKIMVKHYSARGDSTIHEIPMIVLK